jgi:hypothetical protein
VTWFGARVAAQFGTQFGTQVRARFDERSVRETALDLGHEPDEIGHRAASERIRSGPHLEQKWSPSNGQIGLEMREMGREIGGKRSQKTNAKANPKRRFQPQIRPQNEPKSTLQPHSFLTTRQWQIGLKSLKLKSGVDFGFNFNDFTV